MRANIADAAREPRFCRISTPCRLLIAAVLQWLHQPVLNVLDKHLPDSAKRSLAHHLTSLAYGRIAGVVVGERENTLAALDKLHQCPRLVEVEGHRLITDHMNTVL